MDVKEPLGTEATKALMVHKVPREHEGQQEQQALEVTMELQGTKALLVLPDQEARKEQKDTRDQLVRRGPQEQRVTAEQLVTLGQLELQEQLVRLDLQEQEAPRVPRARLAVRVLQALQE